MWCLWVGDRQQPPSEKPEKKDFGKHFKQPKKKYC